MVKELDIYRNDIKNDNVQSIKEILNKSCNRWKLKDDGKVIHIICNATTSRYTDVR